MTVAMAWLRRRFLTGIVVMVPVLVRLPDVPFCE